MVAGLKRGDEPDAKPDPRRAGEALPIDEATTARLTCDAEHIGDLESDEVTRGTQSQLGLGAP